MFYPSLCITFSYHCCNLPSSSFSFSLFILRDVNDYWSITSHHKINNKFRKIKKRKFIYRIMNKFDKKNLKIYITRRIFGFVDLVHA